VGDKLKFGSVKNVFLIKSFHYSKSNNLKLSYNVLYYNMIGFEEFRFIIISYMCYEITFFSIYELNTYDM
jgi:hypothetical protein